MYYVYILKSLKDGGYYTGCTANLEERLKRHNGRRVASTKHRAPLTLEYNRSFDNLSDALKYEKSLKKENKLKIILRGRAAR